MPGKRAPKPAKLAVPAAVPPRVRRSEEPVWLVRLAILLFLIGFAAFLAREARNLLGSF